MRTVLFVQLLLLALWFGGGVALMFFAAPAAFAAAPDRTTAANVVGAILHRWHYLALIAPTLLLAIEWRSGLPNASRVVILAASIVLAACQVGVDAKVRSMRMKSSTPISELQPDDPYRRRFGMLHGVSSLVMLLQVVAAGAALWTSTRPYHDYAPRYHDSPQGESIDL